MPPPNDVRRRALADAAIELLCEGGVHAVTHRAVERRAGLPDGTASNYFRSREALLVATAERVVEQHHADLAAAEAVPHRKRGPQLAVDLIAGSLLEAATVHRRRYLAVFELRLESLRRPALAAALDRLMGGTEEAVAAHHARLGLGMPAGAVPLMMVMYGGALFTLVTAPPGSVTAESVRPLAEHIVFGALHAADPKGAGAARSTWAT